MNKITYSEAYDKIIQAYFKDEIKPFDSKFCFCGTLHNNKDTWCTSDDSWFQKLRPYSKEELIKMEAALLSEFLCYEDVSFGGGDFPGDWYGWVDPDDNDGVNNYEDILFRGMCSALDALKEIHKDRGENVDQPAPFEKRRLTTKSN